jgi:hypothetical protein
VIKTTNLSSEIYTPCKVSSRPQGSLISEKLVKCGHETGKLINRNVDFSVLSSLGLSGTINDKCRRGVR